MTLGTAVSLTSCSNKPKEKEAMISEIEKKPMNLFLSN